MVREIEGLPLVFVTCLAVVFLPITKHTCLSNIITMNIVELYISSGLVNRNIALFTASCRS